MVIALGGVLVNSSIRSSVLNKCVSFWLNIDIKNLKDRFRNSKNRPLLISGDLEENLTEILKKGKNFTNWQITP